VSPSHRRSWQGEKRSRSRGLHRAFTTPPGASRAGETPPVFLRRATSPLTLISSGLLVIALAAVTALAWVGDNSGAAGSSPDGPAIFQTRGCVGCHSIQGVSVAASIGPDLTRVSERAGDRIEGLSPRDYVAQSVRSPQAFIVPGYTAIMPTFELTDDELDVLVDFLLEDR
jgi:cytochrome c551/c552